MYVICISIYTHSIIQSVSVNYALETAALFLHIRLVATSAPTTASKSTPPRSQRHSVRRRLRSEERKSNSKLSAPLVGPFGKSAHSSTRPGRSVGATKSQRGANRSAVIFHPSCTPPSLSRDAAANGSKPPASFALTEKLPKRAVAKDGKASIQPSFGALTGGRATTSTRVPSTKLSAPPQAEATERYSMRTREQPVL